MIEKIINDSGYNIFFLVADKYLDVDLPELDNFHKIYCQSDDIKNSGRLLEKASSLEYINKFGGDKIAIMPFKPSAKVDLICKKNNWKLIANNHKLNRLLEDKIEFVDLVSSKNLPLLPYQIGSWNKEFLENCQMKFNEKNLVVQTHFGWAGKSTSLFNGWEKDGYKLNLGTPIKVTPLVDGYTLINNACLTKKGLIVSPPGLQYTGIFGLTDNPFATVGRQWPSMASVEIEEQINSITKRFSELLIEIGYRGFFGIDFMVSNEVVYILECNPRLTASFGFYDVLEKKSGRDRMLLMHIAEFLDLDFPIINVNNAVQGSEITKKDSEGKTVYKYQEFKPLSMSADPVVIKDDVLKRLSLL